MAITILEVVRFLIQKGPGRTQRQLAEAIFGRTGCQQRVNWECHHLVQTEGFEQRGAGRAVDPFTYYPASNAIA